MQLGVIGLGTMGANLARNAGSRSIEVAVFNRTFEKTQEFMAKHSKEGKFIASDTLKSFVDSLKSPRAILLMVKAGDAVDAVVTELLPLLKKGDILIDGGNSHFRDTDRREAELEKKGIHFVGMGVSGGEEGALKGPSMMPGGSKESYAVLEPMLKMMAADDGSTPLTAGSVGGKCVSHMGPGGAGHFVKMVHNGIEYGIMQLIAEAYHILKAEGKMTNAKLADLFGEWNKDGLLQSFLTEITAKVLRKKDDKTGKDLVDLIQDKAGQKGTGKWTTDAAMEFGVAVPTITAAVDARIISSAKDFRIAESKRWTLATSDFEVKDLSDAVRSALELSISNVYGQGFVLMNVASTDKKWNLNASEIARIWRGGCIIRSALLPHFQSVFAGDKKASEFMIGRFSADAQKQWRSIVALGALKALPLPAMSASLAYFDAYRTERLPQNIIQAQRDFFGAHTYERTDQAGTFHTEWAS